MPAAHRQAGAWVMPPGSAPPLAAGVAARALPVPGHGAGAAGDGAVRGPQSHAGGGDGHAQGVRRSPCLPRNLVLVPSHSLQHSLARYPLPARSTPTALCEQSHAPCSFPRSHLMFLRPQSSKNNRLITRHPVAVQLSTPLELMSPLPLDAQVLHLKLQLTAIQQQGLLGATTCPPGTSAEGTTLRQGCSM